METEHIKITPSKTMLEFHLPNGRDLYYEFEANHKLIKSLIWFYGNLEHMQMP